MADLLIKQPKPKPVCNQQPCKNTPTKHKMQTPIELYEKQRPAGPDRMKIESLLNTGGKQNITSSRSDHPLNPSSTHSHAYQHPSMSSLGPCQYWCGQNQGYFGRNSDAAVKTAATNSTHTYRVATTSAEIKANILDITITCLRTTIPHPAAVTLFVPPAARTVSAIPVTQEETEAQAQDQLCIPGIHTICGPRSTMTPSIAAPTCKMLVRNAVLLGLNTAKRKYILSGTTG